MHSTRRRWGLVLGASALLGAGFALGRRSAPLQAAGLPATAAATATAPARKRWTCPMHPHVDQSAPGECPICGMELVPRDAAGLQASTTAPSLHLSEQVQQNSGVRVEGVEPKPWAPKLWVTGQVLADERRALTLAPKVEGWAKRLGVAGVGQPVRRGQMLVEIFSPELQLRQREYLEILSRRDTLQAQAGSMKAAPGGGTNPDMMLGSVARERFRMRNRLLAADLPPALVDELEASRRVRDVVPVLAPHDGVVSALNVREGAYVMPAQVMLEVGGVQAAWVEVLLTAEQLGQLKPQATLRVRSSVDPHTAVQLPIEPVAAVLSTGSRMARVRAPLQGTRAASAAFPVGSLVEGEIVLPARQALVIPADAVIHSGRGSFVFLETQPQHFARRAVRVGPVVEGQVEVLEGLHAGERLVVNGQFLLSAEMGGQAQDDASPAAMAASAPAHHAMGGH
ncbi:efflux RND transporter periplasmic adaptor subunit [Inhella proteolytica]|uniref:Efflux RND transporter periplasmic adaptor subunit n=1 Tax=Inhella proteolytica TaxID=2795029 RepID=A0A931J979_9BURK|nr:efflux RND transporter periplasmic adaptor subunit [Inhella proteolytica]MBH9578692.1 efflux RND transporter periplasmic adaptor subunit [Inhella proteolytica]